MRNCGVKQSNLGERKRTAYPLLSDPDRGRCEAPQSAQARQSQIAAAHPAAEQRGMFRAAALLFDLIQKSKSFI